MKHRTEQSNLTGKWKWYAWESFGRESAAAGQWGCKESRTESRYCYMTREGAELGFQKWMKGNAQ